MTLHSTDNVTIRLIDEKGTWEMFVLMHGPHALFQSWSWYETLLLAKAKVKPFGVYVGEELVAVFLSHVVSARRGSFVHLRHGPILSPSAPESVWQEIAEFTKEIARKNNCWFVRMSPQMPVGDKSDTIRKNLHGIPASLHRMDGEYVWILDLHLSEEALLSNMRKATRYEIRRAQKDGVEIVASRDIKYLNEFDALYKETADRHGFVPHEGIREEFTAFSKCNQAMVYMGKYKGKTYASAIVLYYGTQAIYHHGASVNAPVPISASVQWRALCDAKKRGMSVYNFWGIASENNPRHPWRGITVFKKGFGGHSVEYMHAFDIPISPLYALTRVVDLYRKYKRGYD